MKNFEVASRYAKAIYGLAKEEGQQEKVLAEVSALADVLEDKELKAHLNSPLMNEEDKKSIVNRLLDSADFSGSTKNFINLVADKGRLSILTEVSMLFQKYIDEEKGLVRGEVVSATDLTDEDKTNIEAKVTSLLNKKLFLEYKKDPSFLGGVVVKVGDYTIDYSVGRQLERIKESLNEGVQ